MDCFFFPVPSNFQVRLVFWLSDLFSFSFISLSFSSKRTCKLTWPFILNSRTCNRCSTHLTSGDYCLFSSTFILTLPLFSPNPAPSAAFGVPPLCPVTADGLRSPSAAFASASTSVNTLLFVKAHYGVPSTSAHLLFTAAYPPWVVERWSLSQMTVDARRQCTTDKSPAFSN